MIPPTSANSPPPLKIPSTEPPLKTSGTAITSLVLGILVIFTFALTSLPAIIFGHVARRQIRKADGRLAGRGLAMAGLVLGYLSAAVVLALIIIVPLLWIQKTATPNGTNVESFAKRAVLVIPATATATDYKWMPGMDSMARLRLEMPAADLDEFLSKSKLEGELRNTTRSKAFSAVYGDFLPAHPTNFREGQKALSGGAFLNVLVDEDSPTKVIVYLMWFET